MARILVVDDEKMVCEEFRNVLEDEGHQVDVALRGREAIEMVRQTSYDLVFLDVLMPQMEGREVFEQIKKISPVPVAIMSGYMPPNKEKDVMALGAVACLSKPFDLGKIRSLVNSLDPGKKS